MTCQIIRLDQKIVGIAEHDDNGINLLKWFHKNKPSVSMSHALEYEGYSVDSPSDIDCRDVESIIGAICERAGITMESSFVPFSQSRHAKPEKGSKLWRCLNWKVTFSRNGREFLTTDYAQGEGHIPNPDNLRSNLVMRDKQIVSAIETGKINGATSYRPLTIPAPSIGDVMQSVIRDSDVLDYSNFADWAENFGYDSDSIKAESIYKQCLEIGLALRNALGESLLSELRLAASYN